MNTPNKVTLVAAALYTITPPDREESKAVNKPLWISLTDAQKKPYNAASEFLAGYAHGSDFHALDRHKAAAALEAAVPEVTANANEAVDLFLNISALLG